MALLAAGFPRAAAAQVVDDPRLEVQTVFAGLEEPTAFAFLEIDELFVLERASGRVQWIRDGRRVRTVLQLAVNSSGNRGTLGLALDPDFATNGAVYIYYSAAENGVWVGNRLVRGTFNGTRIVKPRTLPEFPRDRAQRNDAGLNGGALRFGPDGTLYGQVGSLGRGAGVRTGDLRRDSGWLKIIGPDRRDATYAANGNEAHDRGDLVRLPGSSYRDPLFSWADAPGVSGLVFLDTAAYGAQLRNQLLVGTEGGDLFRFALRAGAKRKRLKLSGSLRDRVADPGDTEALSIWGADFGAIHELRLDPTGILHVSDRTGGRILRIVERDVAPAPSATYLVTFDATWSAATHPDPAFRPILISPD